MDIGPNNYPFQCFLCFLTLKFRPSFSVNHIKSQKMYLGPQIFTQQKNISYEETCTKISFQNKVLHPNIGEMKLA